MCLPRLPILGMQRLVPFFQSLQTAGAKTVKLCLSVRRVVTDGKIPERIVLSQLEIFGGRLE